jgi:organic anion transporter 3A
MELIIVSGFVVFLPKYLETQFSLGKSQASVFTGKTNRFLSRSLY